MKCRAFLLALIFHVCSVASLMAATDHARDSSLANGEYVAEINGIKLWYKVSGTGPVCLLPTPGWGPSSDLYFLRFTPLETTFTMIYLDTRGCGRSERPDLHAYSMRDLVADLEGLRQHLGIDSMWLMGHSDGGPMILNYACTHRDRVKGIILIDAPAGTPGESKERVRRLQMRKGESWFDEAWKVFQTPPRSQKEFENYINGILPFFFSSQKNLANSRDVFERTSVSFDAQQGRGLSDQSAADLAAILPTVKIPSLIIVGEDDFVCPPTSAAALHAMIPGSALVEINNAGHFPWLEEPKVFFESVHSFLQGRLEGPK